MWTNRCIYLSICIFYYYPVFTCNSLVQEALTQPKAGIFKTFLCFTIFTDVGHPQRVVTSRTICSDCMTTFGPSQYVGMFACNECMRVSWNWEAQKWIGQFWGPWCTRVWETHVWLNVCRNCCTGFCMIITCSCKHLLVMYVTKNVCKYIFKQEWHIQIAILLHVHPVLGHPW